jgi:hypothetical protein
MDNLIFLFQLSYDVDVVDGHKEIELDGFTSLFGLRNDALQVFYVLLVGLAVDDDALVNGIESDAVAYDDDENVVEGQNHVFGKSEPA